MLSELEMAVYFIFGDRGEIWWGLVEAEGEGEDRFTWNCSWGV